MIYVVAKAEIRPECLDAYLEVLKEFVPQVLGEEGCIRYEPCVEWSADGVRRPFVTMMETWESKACLDQHLSTPRMQEFRAKIADMRTGAADLQILEPALH
jgi:quinol monooxygenase YgiN